MGLNAFYLLHVVGLGYSLAVEKVSSFLRGHS